jgi:hypothetical protein
MGDGGVGRGGGGVWAERGVRGARRGETSSMRIAIFAWSGCAFVFEEGDTLPSPLSPRGGGKGQCPWPLHPGTSNFRIRV